MFAIMKNDWYRILAKKHYLVVSMMMTICAVVAAIVLTNNIKAKGNIAVVGMDAKDVDSEYYTITYLDEEPEESKLLENRYDAVIDFNKDGSYEIKTIKSDDFKEKLENILKDPSSAGNYEAEERHVGTNIIGYMMMFVLMQGILYTRVFAEDKEEHLAERVTVSPLAFMKYIAGHGIFSWVLIFIPSMIIIIAAKICGASIGFSIPEYIGIIGVLALLSSSFALLVVSFSKVADTANMIGCSAITLTTMLSGSFVAFTKESSLFNKMLYILPQKDLMNFVDLLEKGNIGNNAILKLSYVIILSVILLSVAVMKTRRDYIYNTRS